MKLEVEISNEEKEAIERLVKLRSWLCGNEDGQKALAVARRMLGIGSFEKGRTTPAPFASAVQIACSTSGYEIIYTPKQ